MGDVVPVVVVIAVLLLLVPEFCPQHRGNVRVMASVMRMAHIVFMMLFSLFGVFVFMVMVMVVKS